jgi:protoporphyrinogen oxidase
MWEEATRKVIEMGNEVRMNTGVRKIEFTGDSWSVSLSNGTTEDNFDYVISSAPIRELIPHVLPAMPAKAIQASQDLKYRDFLTVVLILKDKNVFDDNWIYIHDPSVKVGRVQNFKSWSPFMVPDDTMACYGLEYFCFEGDGMWTSSDETLIELGKKELQQIGLGKATDVVDGYVVRQPKAYPVYDAVYKEKLDDIRESLADYPGLYLVGRNGMHKYNNQDHSMMTAMLAVKNIVAGKELFDLWNVNGDAEYHEAGERGAEEGGRLVPSAVAS